MTELTRRSSFQKRLRSIVASYYERAPADCKGRTAALYLRRSTDFGGLEADINCLLHFADRQNLQVLPQLVNCDLGSGTRKRQRPGLAELLEAIKAGNTAVLVVSDLSQLSRDPSHSLMLLERLRVDYGVRVVAPSASGDDELR